MNREEWISYYESINGHKPSVLEVAKAEKDGEIFVLYESSNPSVIDDDSYTSYNENTYTHKNTVRKKNRFSNRYVFQMYLGCFTRSIYSCNLDIFHCVMDCRFSDSYCIFNFKFHFYFCTFLLTEEYHIKSNMPSIFEK